MRAPPTRRNPPTTFIEVKLGLRDALVLERIRRKYAVETPVRLATRAGH